VLPTHFPVRINLDPLMWCFGVLSRFRFPSGNSVSKFITESGVFVFSFHCERFHNLYLSHTVRWAQHAAPMRGGGGA
jgi:hypothetical protein